MRLSKNRVDAQQLGTLFSENRVEPAQLKLFVSQKIELKQWKNTEMPVGLFKTKPKMLSSRANRVEAQLEKKSCFNKKIRMDRG